MARYKIGITEAGDAGIDLSWVSKMDNLDGAILITKKITSEFCNAVLHKENIILHATITGYGSSALEPNVPKFKDELQRLIDLVDEGFPEERVVVRIDPIIPIGPGLKIVQRMFKASIDAGFRRFRVSMVDMYPHVRDRFKSIGYPLPYGDNFYPYSGQVSSVDSMILWAKEYSNNTIRVEACAEPDLNEAIQCGCISDYDLELLGLSACHDNIGFQRKNCLCYSGKIELLSSKSQCPNGCLYCYWKG